MDFSLFGSIQVILQINARVPSAEDVATSAHAHPTLGPFPCTCPGLLRATPLNFRCRLWPTYYVPGPEITTLLGDLSAEVHREQVTFPGPLSQEAAWLNSNPDRLTSHLGRISLDSSMKQRSQRLLEYGQRPREGVSIF